jgi:uncharacterized membrane protein YkoI
MRTSEERRNGSAEAHTDFIAYRLRWKSGGRAGLSPRPEVKGGKVLHGVIALVIGAATVSRMVPGASAQDEEGTGDVEPAVAAGTLYDGQTLLPLAGISLDAAVQAAQGATSGVVGEVDLEYVGDRLVFNVDVGDQNVKVEAISGAVLSVDMDE